MTVKTIAKRIGLMLVLLALLTSCMTVRVPEPRNSKQAILVFPMEYLDDAPGTFTFDYLFYGYRTDIASSLPFTIEIKTNKWFNVYRHLPPTSNVIRKVMEVERESGDAFDSKRYDDINFELQGGKINVFPYMVRVELVRSKEPGAKRKPVQRVYFDPLRDYEYSKFVEKLAEIGVNTDLVEMAIIPEEEK